MQHTLQKRWHTQGQEFKKIENVQVIINKVKQKKDSNDIIVRKLDHLRS